MVNPVKYYKIGKRQQINGKLENVNTEERETSYSNEVVLLGIVLL